MRLWAILLFFLPSLACLAQHTNSWVTHNHPYYKIKVANTGIYRLTYDQLQQAGVPVNAIDPRTLQLFHRGTEQSIYFKHDQSPADSKFDNTEYLEFYGQRNDGTLDEKLYPTPSAQPHKYYNLFSDTTSYFLTASPLLAPGRQMELIDQVNSSGLPKETSHQAERLRVNSAEYNTGEVIDKFINQSYFDKGEGWTGETICSVNAGCSEFRDYVVDQVVNTASSQPPPTIEVQLSGRDELLHEAEIYAGPSTSSLRLVASKSFINYETPIVTQSLLWTDVGPDGKVVVRVKGLGVGGIRERLSVAYIKISYPQGFNMASVTTRTFNLNQTANVESKSFIELENAPAGMRLWDITVPSAVARIATRASGSSLTAIVPNTQSLRKLFAASTFLTPVVEDIKAVTFQDLNTQANFIIVTHPSLMKAGLEYPDPVAAYASYRSSTAGGGYVTQVVTIDQVYDQFSYGEISPLGIRELMRYMIDEGDPQYLFLVGKGRDLVSGIHRRVPSSTESPDLVPTAGHPGSDMVFTAGLKGDPFVPAVATGRLTATTPAQVAAYLNKVKQTEAAPFDDLWRKRILHLSGGIRPNELVLFKGFMQGFAQIAKGDFLGGEVLTLGKHGIDPIEFINISKEINTGIDLVTFFGHSASNTTDIDIGNVSTPANQYNNPGKYPAFLVNGCNAGEYFNNGANFGEDWILANNKGARNFIANSSFGYEDALRVYTTYFYQVGFADSLYMTKGIGDVQKEVARRFLGDLGITSKFTAQVQQMVLLGDPSLKLFPASKPDFSVSDGGTNAVAFDDKPIHALTDSIEVQVVTRNLGRSTKAALKVKIVHTANNVVTTYDSVYNSVRNMDTIRFPISRGSGNFYGDNKIEVFIDPDNKIAELNEDNNKSEWTKFILFNGTHNLQPADFGIVTTKTPTVLFQDTDVLAEGRTYQVELDTTAAFNSSFKQSKNLSGKILLKTTFNLLDKDSTVYYWRTKPSDRSEEEWETTSFSYIKDGPDGWAQMAYDQFSENALNSLVANDDKRKFDFEETSVSIIVKNLGSANATPGATGSFLVNDAEYYYSQQGFNCRNNTINVVAFDRSTVVPYLAIPFTFENAAGRACGREPQLINSFTHNETSTGNQDDLIQLVDNVKTGDSIVLFSMGDAGFNLWPADVKTKLGELGISVADIDNFLPGEPIIILGKKGAAVGTAKIIKSGLAQPETQELQLTETLTGNVSSGSIRSVLIGPALKWNALTPRFSKDNASEQFAVDVYQIARDGGESMVIYDQKTPVNLDNVDASTYPFIRLVFRTTDNEVLTPAELRKWIVDFDPAPDGLLIPRGSAAQVQVNEGAPHTTNFDFVNITSVNFTDSLQSVFSVFNRRTGQKERQNFLIKGPGAGDTTHFSRTTQTTGKAGLNDIALVVNNTSVTEQYYQNNSLELPAYLNVIKDSFNPVLEVTVDGRYLSNGDFVSANPLIKVVLRDENPLLMLRDTTTLTLSMSVPCNASECVPARVNFSRSDVKWSVADNQVVVEFTPKNLKNGEYTFYARGFDRSGNPSGEEEYSVSFVVEDEEGMIFYDPYPNPSPAGFFFEFTAAGDAAPESFALNIIDRNGRDIAQFTEDNSPALRVGMNQLRWSGLDAHGHRLSEGLYFYLLKVRSGEYEFKKSGRIMIIR